MPDTPARHAADQCCDEAPRLDGCRAGDGRGADVLTIRPRQMRARTLRGLIRCQAMPDSTSLRLVTVSPAARAGLPTAPNPSPAARIGRHARDSVAPVL